MSQRAQETRRARPGLAVVAVVVVTLLALVGCSSSKKADSASATSSVPVATGDGPPDSQVVDRFWATISRLDPLATATPGQAKAAALAQQVCASITPGMTVQQAQAAATAVLNTAGVRPAAIPYWAGAASAAFCPQYSKLFTGS